MIISQEKLPKLRQISTSPQCWLTLTIIMEKRVSFKSVLMISTLRLPTLTLLLENSCGRKNLFCHLFQICQNINSWSLKYTSMILMWAMVSILIFKAAIKIKDIKEKSEKFLQISIISSETNEKCGMIFMDIHLK